MIERLLVLLAALTLALLWVRWRERRRPSGLRMAPGITVYTGPDCRLCAPLLGELERVGAVYRLIDVSREPAAGIGSVPTVVVADQAGDVVIRRSGRSAVTDLDSVLAVAASGGAVRESA